MFGGGLAHVYLCLVAPVILLFMASPVYALSNVTVAHASLAQANLSQGSQLYLSLDILNNGTTSSGNLSIGIAITGPRSYHLQYPIAPLYPGENYNISFFIPNATNQKGTYYLSASVNYLSAGSVATSPPLYANYTVSNAIGQYSYSTPQILPASLPYLQASNLPIYSFFNSGTSYLTELDLNNTGKSGETVTIAVPQQYSNMASLSASAVSLYPKQAIQLDMLLNPSAAKGLPIGTYTFPINFNVEYYNGTSKYQTYFVTFSLINDTYGLGVTGQYDLVNSNTISGVLTVKNPTKNIISDVAISSFVPTSVIVNASDVSVSGVPVNLTLINGQTYKVTWNFGTMYPDTAAYSYYTIRNPLQLLTPASFTNYIKVSSTIPSSSILDVTNPTVPTFAPGAAGFMSVSVFYTGTSAQQIIFSLTPPQGFSIQNSTQSVIAYPNQHITKTFKITPSFTTGTYITTLYIYTNGANYSYYLPFVVSPVTAQRRIAIVGTNQSVSVGTVEAVILLILIVVVVLIARKRFSKASYSRERQEHLMRIKKRMDLSTEGNKDG